MALWSRRGARMKASDWAPGKPAPAPNWTDRALVHVAPQFALRRYWARRAMALSGGYSGARRDRSGTLNWKPGGGSADADLLCDLETLRDRSRDLVRNNPLARGAIRTNVTSVVGPGLKVKAQIDRAALKLDDAAADAWENRSEQLFRHWCRAAECDLTGVQDFEGLQGLVFRAVLESGDCIVPLRMRGGAGLLFETTLEVIEADRLANPNRRADTAIIAGGVEADLSGRPIAYHIASRHPGDATLSALATKWERFPARDSGGMPLVLHVFERARIGQRRGEPYLAPVVEALKQLSNYAEAELDAAVMSACFAVFIKSATPVTLPQNTGVTGTASNTDYYKDVDLQKASIVTMRTGDEIQTATPGRPNANFDPFFLSVCRQIGVALELPYEILIKHFTASYSAARAALMEAWRAFKSRRAWLVSTFCQPAYETVLAEAVARGLIAAPGFFTDPLMRAAWCGAKWIGPAPGQIDPQREVDAAIKRVESTFTTYAEETAAINGGDWERQFPQRKREQEMLRAAGLSGAVGSGRSGAAEAGGAPGIGHNGGPPIQDDGADKPEGGDEAASAKTPITINQAPVNVSLPPQVVNVQPTPIVVNVSPQPVNLTVQPPAVSVAAPEVHIAAPAVSVTPPAVYVAAPEVHVHAPKKGAVERTVTAREADGSIKTVVEREIGS